VSNLQIFEYKKTAEVIIRSHLLASSHDEQRKHSIVEVIAIVLGKVNFASYCASTALIHLKLKYSLTVPIFFMIVHPIENGSRHRINYSFLPTTFTSNIFSIR
jgi:hypothetical protein